jgi:5-methylcytosine-specific restriction endonuclease McrA
VKWSEPKPKWRTAQKQYQCQGDGCTKVIAPGERYLDRTIRHPAHGHVRYCQECAEPVIRRAEGHHIFNGRNDFPDRYQQHISSVQWKSLRRKVIEQRGNRCERCGQEGASLALALHHKQYRSLGDEQLEDVELLCRECHTGADEAREAKSRPKRDDLEEGLIVGIDGDHWGMFDPDTSYVPLKDGRYVPLKLKRKS